jgi:hypothetical protein
MEKFAPIARSGRHAIDGAARLSTKERAEHGGSPARRSDGKTASELIRKLA